MKGMIFACDESLVFDMKVDPNNGWRNAVVGGVLLNYETRRWWRKNFNKFPQKCKDYRNAQIGSVLRTLVSRGAISHCHVVHLSVEPEEVKQCQADLLRPHFDQIFNQPEHLRESVQFHLETLSEMKPSTFAKTWTMLEVVVEGVASYLGCIGRERSQDQRGLNILIDDQVTPSLPALKDFVWYFLNCRSRDGVFSFTNGITRQIERHLQSSGKAVNLTTMINRIVVGKQGDQLDDKIVELRVADLICNLTARRFKGELSSDACNLLEEIVTVHPHYFGKASERRVDIPEQARAGLATLSEL